LLVTRSLLLNGILAEDPEAARAQVWAFDHATVTGEIGRRVQQLADHASRKLPLIEPLAGVIGSGFSQSAPSDPVRHARDDELILPIKPDHWRAAKLGRILNHFNLRFAAAPSEAELVHLCLEAEARAVTLLRSLAGSTSTKKGMEPFNGSSLTELSRWVLRRMFVELDDNFARKPLEEQERIAEEIAGRLAELPDDVRERIQREAGVAELSADALRRTGVIAAIGGALVGTVGIAGFAAYTTVTSIIATAAGFVGLTLPFAVYIHATAALAFLSNPLLLTATVLFGGHFALSRANRQIRDRFIPIMVATAAMASAVTPQPAAPSSVVKELGRYFESLHTADRKLATQIHNTFRCFPQHA
jgi:hypothetical protein